MEELDKPTEITAAELVAIGSGWVGRKNLVEIFGSDRWKKSMKLRIR